MLQANILTKLSNVDIKSSSLYFLEFVRWRRKPRWLPVAKSKVFKVPERKKQLTDERAELLRLHNNYKTQMRSVRQYLRQEVLLNQETSTADHIVFTPEQEEAEFQRCLQENLIWNSKIASERENRLQNERSAKTAYIKERLLAAKFSKEEQQERIEAIVRKEKEISQSYIKREDLDNAIDVALQNPMDYNFSIDLTGNAYWGRATIPVANV